MKAILIIVLLFIFPLYSYAQSKVEIEERIEKKDVPLPAQQFIDSLCFSSKIKWFVEQNYITKTFEAKITANGTTCSIEFDSLGKIEDVEVEISWKKISEDTQGKINEQLNTDFEKHKIKKIQIQYSGKETDLLNFRTNTENLTIKYEIVVKGQKESKIEFYEYLFSEKGELENKVQFDFRNTDHLEY
ncbi:MAG: hypothetical protein COZ18_01665 [Flexibacter sp. CG_4_10_14_3_um_filter_32_15]|nr:MAG: hypothetical protein COZ18_01665 [Flexibacter sp. CG_4_10_14_3_um_filter_32_15]